MSDLEQTAIERLKAASDMSLRLFEKPLVITYSGGKDSDVLLHLARASGIPNAARLGELIEKAVDDALEAKGCSLDLKYPEKLSNADDTRMVTWASWLNEEM